MLKQLQLQHETKTPDPFVSSFYLLEPFGGSPAGGPGGTSGNSDPGKGGSGGGSPGGPLEGGVEIVMKNVAY